MDDTPNIASAVAGLRQSGRKRQPVTAQPLPESEQRYRQLLDALPAAVYTCDGNGRVTMCNRAAVELWGREPELGQDMWCGSWRIYRPDGTPLPLDQCPMAVAIREGRPVYGVEIVIERPDGTRRNILPYPVPMLDDSGKVVGANNMLFDITERKQFEQARARMAAIVESSDDAIIGKDLNSVITSWNRAAERIFGFSSQEAIGQPITMLIPPDRFGEEPDILERIRRGERIEHYETVRRRKDGSLLNISLTVSPIFDERGKVVGASKIARDISERKYAEEERRVHALERERLLASEREARAEAEAANRAKDKFLAVLSHELRTPLTPVVMTVAAMETDPELPFRLREDVQMIRRNIDLEARLIDDLLDLSRVASGKLRLRMKPTHVHDLLRHVVNSSANDIASKGLTVRTQLDARSDLVMADSARLQQVVWNLLRNAIKFTPDGGEIRVHTSNVGETWLLIQVQDNGMGIAPEVLPKLFNPFEQGDQSVTSQFGGLGLGLAVAKTLVEKHGGSIRATSDGPGKGAVFSVQLLNIVTVPKEVPNPASGSSNPTGRCRVLLVEDHEDTARTLAKLLTQSGYAVRTAENAKTALQLAAAESFDIVLSDVGLPDASGYELMRQVRDRFGLKGIALTGYGMEDDLRQSMEAGFVDHFTKPVDLQALEAAIQRAAKPDAISSAPCSAV